MSDDEARITRTIDTDLPVDELWSLVRDGWSDWMVDDAEIVVEPGARGTVFDDGVRRDVLIERVEPPESVTFTWWPQARPDETSTVELVVVPALAGSRLHVSETLDSGCQASLAWDVRAMLLASRAVVLV